MRIAQVSPLYESVPPKLYGGTERVVSNLTEALVKRGHKVTLFASGDSETSAKLVSVCKSGLRLNKDCPDPVAYHLLMIERLMKEKDNFDIIHFHIDYLHFPFLRNLTVPHLTTLHNNLNIPAVAALYKEYKEIPVTSISYHQRDPLPSINWQGNVYHGLPLELLKQGKGKGGYLAFLGRISPEKGPEVAIEIAKAADVPLKIAAKIDKGDQDYFDRHISKLLDHPLIEFIGEVNERQKEEFLGNAMGLLFPIKWPEPFGLVMIESMACGTPVIAFEHGSVSELLEDRKTGFIVKDASDAVAAIGRLNEIDRGTCRKTFEERFSVGTMCEAYVKIYNEIIESRKNRMATFKMTIA